MSKNKKKTVPEAKQKQPKAVVKLSGECEACKNQCHDGLDYISRMNTGKVARGNGVVCRG